jgi:hypothetical protein
MPMMIRLLCIAAAWVVMSFAPALADQIKIGSTAIELPALDGYCALHDSDPLEARKLARQIFAKGTNLLLAEFDDCSEEAEWKAGTREHVEDYVQAQTLAAQSDNLIQVPPEAAANQICALLRQKGADLAKSTRDEVNTTIATVASRIKLNEFRFIGVVAEEPRICYAAAVGVVAADDGTQKSMVSVFGATLIKGKWLYHYVYTPDTGSGVIDKALAKEEAFVAASIAANP